MSWFHKPSPSAGIYNQLAPRHGCAALRVGLVGVCRVIAKANVMAGMFTGRHQLQVLAAVVLSISIQVVDVFAAGQYAPDLVLNDESVLRDESLVGLGVFRPLYQHVAVIDHPLDCSLANRSGVHSQRVPENKTSRESSKPIRTGSADLGNGCLLSTPTKTEAVSRVVRWRERVTFGLPVRLLRFSGPELMPRDKPLPSVSLGRDELASASTFANAHVVIIPKGKSRRYV